MNKYIEALKAKQDVRRTLIEMKTSLKNEADKNTLARSLAGDFSVLTGFLEDQDPKVRKNAALILGELGEQEFRELLWKAYCREGTLYVRSDYLKALLHYDCRDYLPAIRKRIREIDEGFVTAENEKHMAQEQNMLKELLVKNDRPSKHRFTGYEERLEVILLTNRLHRETTARQILEAGAAVREKASIKMLAGGLHFETEQLKKVLEIRTYTELLFPVPGAAVLSGSPAYMAKILAHSRLVSFLEEHHDKKAPYCFRLELRTSMPQEQKVDLVKKLSAAIEKESGRKLLNVPGDYEIELRLVANKEGGFVPMLRLFTIPDRRFSYRKETLPTSAAPVNVALMMELAREYLTEGAQVLDPFCGTGTMLIERQYRMSAGSMYGIDILGEAIEKARKNTAVTGMENIYYINKNFFDFEHTYLFDEVVTNLPGEGRTRGEKEVCELYCRFLEKLPEHVKPGACILAYTPCYRVLKNCLKGHREYRLLKEYCINEREGSYMAVFVYNG
ncbi:MAG: methyltransferase domain-containing protein [Eubacteriales bacterium]|nr:methyltransferase domain-containing protein [Eubacteriales bacterium]